MKDSAEAKTFHGMWISLDATITPTAAKWTKPTTAAMLLQITTRRLRDEKGHS